jgi:nicotinamidase/pyrazinamidase
VQYDFMPGGALAVPKGDEVVPVINRLAPRFDNVVLTQDWHPRDHISFASSHNRKPFETTRLGYGEQVLWPPHCVQGTRGAELHADLDSAISMSAGSPPTSASRGPRSTARSRVHGAKCSEPA